MKVIENTSSKNKKPWPTKEAMQQIYKLGLWGKEESVFYSGEGSHDIKIVKPYIEAVAYFLDSFKEPLVVCDLGCGDFNVGKEFVTLSRKLIAIDIVTELISYNQSTFKAQNLEFRCLDLAKDTLPEGDCVLVRQVLQHLSNTEIMAILEKLYSYKYIIVTEHLPSEDFIPNLDIISGQGTRLKKGSGVDVLAAPFYFKCKEKRVLCTVDPIKSKGVIQSVLYTMF